MKILITGAASRLGQAISAELTPECELRLIDEDPVVTDGEVEVFQGSLLEPEIAWQAVRGVDAIIHTGEPPADLTAGSEQELLEYATRGTHVLLSAGIEVTPQAMGVLDQRLRWPRARLSDRVLRRRRGRYLARPCLCH